MYLLLSTLLCSVLGILLLFLMGPFFGGIIAFGFIGGCIVRGLYLLNDIHKMMSKIAPNNDRVQDAFENYLKERDENLR